MQNALTPRISNVTKKKNLRNVRKQLIINVVEKFSYVGARWSISNSYNEIMFH